MMLMPEHGVASCSQAISSDDADTCTLLLLLSYSPTLHHCNNNYFPVHTLTAFSLTLKENPFYEKVGFTHDRTDIRKEGEREEAEC